MENALNDTLNAQRRAFEIKFSLGLLHPWSDLNISVRLGQLALNALSRWPLKPLLPKPSSNFRYLTICGRAHWLLLRESLHSLYCSWTELPLVTVISDGSWSEAEFRPVFSWWPGRIQVLSREQVCVQANIADESELAQYAQSSPYGLKLASIVLLARGEPLLFVDADILWFRDPTQIIGSPSSWSRTKGIRESHCYQRRDMALRYCPQVLDPPFVNGGILALHGDFLPRDILRSMVREALAEPMDGSFEQTIIATSVKMGGGIMPENLCLVEFDDIEKFRHRNMRREGFYSRHYVNWMRHLFYRDSLALRFRAN